MPPALPQRLFDNYHIRILMCVAVVLGIFVGAVKLWPVRTSPSDSRPVYVVGERELIEIEEIRPTRQGDSRPPPPAPPIPILVPDETVLADDELEFSDQLLSVDSPSKDALRQDGPPGTSPAQSAGPTVGPKTVRFVEPEYTREARRNRVRAELVVKVLVDERGRVKDSEIIERFLLGKDGISKTPVNLLGYGLEEAALTAADRWIFRPARKNGEPVASQTTLTFTFGIDA